MAKILKRFRQEKIRLNVHPLKSGRKCILTTQQSEYIKSLIEEDVHGS